MKVQFSFEGVNYTAHVSDVDYHITTAYYDVDILMFDGKVLEGRDADLYIDSQVGYMEDVMTPAVIKAWREQA